MIMENKFNSNDTDSVFVKDQTLELCSVLNFLLSVSAKDIYTATKDNFGRLEILLEFLSGTFFVFQLGCKRKDTNTVFPEIFRVAGIAIARTYRLQWALKFAHNDNNCNEPSTEASTYVDQCLQHELKYEEGSMFTNISELGQVAILRGFAQLAACDGLDKFLCQGPLFAKCVIDICASSTDTAVRLAALRALESILTLLIKASDKEINKCHVSGQLHNVASDSLQVALLNWQSNTRQISSAVQPVFCASVTILQRNEGASFDVFELVNKIMGQPSTRKVRINIFVIHLCYTIFLCECIHHIIWIKFKILSNKTYH